jgi:hypothetical protein
VQNELASNIEFCKENLQFVPSDIPHRVLSQFGSININNYFNNKPHFLDKGLTVAVFFYMVLPSR